MSEQRRKYYLAGSSVLRDDIDADQYFDSFPATHARPVQGSATRLNTDLHDVSYHSQNPPPPQRSVLPDLEPHDTRTDHESHAKSREIHPGKENINRSQTRTHREGHDLGKQLYDFLCREVRLKRGVASTKEDTLFEFWKDCVHKLAIKNAFKDNKKFAEYERWGREDPANVEKTIKVHAENREQEKKSLRLQQNQRAMLAIKELNEKKDLKILKTAVQNTYAHRVEMIEQLEEDKEKPKKRESESPFQRAKPIEEDKSTNEVIQTQIFQETVAASRKEPIQQTSKGGFTRLKQQFATQKDRNDYLNLEQTFFHSLLYHYFQADKSDKEALIPAKKKHEEEQKKMTKSYIEEEKQREKQRQGELLLANNAETLHHYYLKHKLSPRLKWELPGGDQGARIMLTELLGREFTLNRIQRLYEESNKGVAKSKRISRLAFWEAMESRKKTLNLINGPYVKDWIEEKEKSEAEQRMQKEKEEQENKEKKAKQLVQSLKKKVLKKDVEPKRLEELSKPKDKWLTGRTMKSLQEKFPHDRVLERMIKEEFRENKVFRYPDEYDVYDEEEEELRKKKAVKTDNLYTLYEKKKSKQQTVKDTLERWLIDDKGKERIAQKEKEEEKKKEQNMHGFVAKKVKEYLNMRKDRLKKKGPTENQYLSQTYQELKTAYPQDCAKLFPLLTYGMNKKSNRYKKSFPIEFKRYFFQLFRSYYHDDDGKMQRLKAPPLTYWLPCSQIQSKNKKALSVVEAGQKKDNNLGGENAWVRKDTELFRSKFLMTQDEVQNCTFQPKIKTGVAITGKRDEEEDSKKAYHERFGLNFKNSVPAIFKAGVLKQARQFYNAGKLKEARSKLKEGFNIKSLYRNFNPEKLKKMEIREQKAKAEKKKKQLEQGFRIENIKEEEDQQAKMPAEDPSLPVVRDAWELWDTLEKDQQAKQKLLKDLEMRKKKKEEESKKREERKGARSVHSTSTERKDKKAYKSMMCPLKDRCPGDIRPRWPMSNTTAHTKMGSKCPYAHHPSELYFEQQDCVTKKSMQGQIDKVNKQIEEAEGGKCWVPPSLVPGVPRQKKLPRSVSEKIRAFNNSKNVLDKKIEKEEKDNEYTKKLGLLRKSTVLYNFERFTEAFKVISKAAIMVKEAKEKEAQDLDKKATLWKFRLKLPKTLDVIGELGDLVKQRGTHFTERDLNAFGIDIPVQKAHILVQKCFDVNGAQKWDKIVYLNDRIEEQYLLCEAALYDKQGMIKLMQKRVEQLEEKGNLPVKTEEQGMTVKEKIERLVPVEKTVSNMQKVIKAMQHNLKDLKAIRPWKPVKAGVVEDSAMMDMRSKRRPKEEEEEDDSPRKRKKKQSIYERDNLGELPFDIEGDEI